MPDLFSHTLSGYLCMRPRWRESFLPSVFLLGCIFPDLVRGPLFIIIKLTPLELRDYFSLQILHSPIPLLTQSWLVAFLFEAGLRKKVFINLLGGIALHLVLDAGQRAYYFSYFWLFPISFENPVPGIWWADESIWITAVLIPITIFVFCLRRGQRK